MGHYSLAHNPAAMNAWASKMARNVAKKYSGTNRIPVLTYRGMSGIATATALANALVRLKNCPSFYMMYCRKYDEVTNGNPEYEMTLIKKNELDAPTEYDFVFVDDFICSGESLAECARMFAHAFRVKLTLDDNNFAILSGGSGNWTGDTINLYSKRYLKFVYLDDAACSWKSGFSNDLQRINIYLNIVHKRKISKRSSYKKIMRKC